MIVELVVRFIAGGLVVSAFAVLGDMLRPKGFAGIFGAAPSVALATLGLTLASHGGRYTAIEGRSMLAGAAALLCYSALLGWLLMRRRLNTLPLAGATCVLWLCVAFGLWGVWIR